MAKPLPQMVLPPLDLGYFDIEHLFYIILDFLFIVLFWSQANQNNQLAPTSILLFLVISPCTLLIKKGREIHLRGWKL